MPDNANEQSRTDKRDTPESHVRSRRERRRDTEVTTAGTGNMPDASSAKKTPASERSPLRRNSWAEAAAAADAEAGKPAPTAAQPATDQGAGVSSDPVIESVPSGAAPARSAEVGSPGVSEGAPAATRRREARAQDDPDYSLGSFVRPQKPRPKGGWRGAVFSMTSGGVNLGPGAKQRNEDELAQRISRQLQGSFNTAVLSLKGGIGKTSTTVGVGLTLAEFRGDPPCAIDANPDSGDLVERALGEGIYQSASPRTISDLLENIESIDSLTALSRYMHHAGRLHLIAGEQDPEVSDSLTAEEYLRIRKLISGYYSVALTDCGTGVTHNAMSGILQSADNLIIAAGYAVSGAKRARSTLLWLAEHGYEELAKNAIVVITDKDEVSSRVDKDAIEDHLSGICRQLIAVPHDRGVADGDLVTLDVLRPETRRAYREIAAAIVDGYL